MGYTKEYKISVMKFCFKGNSIAKTASTFSLGEDTVSRWKREFRQNGELQGRKVQEREHLRKITPEGIEEFLQKFPDGNQQEMAEYFGCKAPSITIALKKFGYSKKKNRVDITKPTKSSERYIWSKSHG